LNTNKSGRLKQLISGSALALLSAITFALNIVLAGMSYQHGANIHALNLSRAMLFLATLGCILLATRTPARLAPRIRNLSIILGLLLCTEMYVLLGAIRTIPVALAVLIFYTYPLIIAIHGWLAGVEKFNLFSMILLLTGFGGLLFVLISAPVVPDINGLLFSLCAAFIMAAMLLVSDKALKSSNNHVVLFYTLSTVVITIVLSIVTTDAVTLAWPIDRLGWVVFSASSFFYVAATFALFMAVNLVGPLRTAIIDNTSPVWAILFGYLLLNQVLTVRQLLGALVVIAAVMLLQFIKRN
jgi:drug/metabolite transporter (DMT)-like permease